MTKAEKERAIACIKLAIELAGDGGPMPFTEKEYELMYNFLDEKSTTTQNEKSLVIEEPLEKLVSLEDVCEFLDEHLHTFTSTDDYDYGQEYIGSDFYNTTDLIFALRKAMD